MTQESTAQLTVVSFRGVTTFEALPCLLRRQEEEEKGSGAYKEAGKLHYMKDVRH